MFLRVCPPGARNDVFYVFLAYLMSKNTIQNGRNRVSRPHVIAPEVRKSHSELVKPGKFRAILRPGPPLGGLEARNHVFFTCFWPLGARNHMFLHVFGPPGPETICFTCGPHPGFKKPSFFEAMFNFTVKKRSRTTPNYPGTKHWFRRRGAESLVV